MKTKKSMIWETMLIATLFIIGLIIFFMIINKLYGQETREDLLMKNCKNSVILNFIEAKIAQASFFTSPEDIKEALKCVTITKNFYLKNNDNSKKELEKKLATDMYRCSDTFLQGKKMFSGIVEEKTCFICYIYNISTENNAEIIIDDFQNYLESNYKSGESYKDFLGPFNSTPSIGDKLRADGFFNPYSDLKFKTGEYYAIIFVYYYTNPWFDKPSYGGATILTKASDAASLGCMDFLTKIQI